MENEMMEVEAHDSHAPWTAAAVKDAVNRIQEVMKAVMKQDVHFGIIQGCKKPSLYKPGAEKLNQAFRITDDPRIDDLSSEDEIRYRVTSRAISIPTGKLLATGLGECSSLEEKYKWRSAVCGEEWEETPEERRREKWFRGKNGGKNYKVKQVRTNRADVANTILKMADKRAYVAATLKATAASDLFTQDIEEMQPEMVETIGEEQQVPVAAKPLPSMPVRKSAPVAVAQPQPAAPAAKPVEEGSLVVHIGVVEVQEKSLQKKDGTGSFQKYFIQGNNGQTYQTTKAELGIRAKDAMAAGVVVEIAYRVGQYGNDILGLVLVGDAVAA